jgi:GNAT superfamily N-acetyltransferase
MSDKPPIAEQSSMVSHPKAAKLVETDYVFTIETTTSLEVNRQEDFFRKITGVIKAEWIGYDNDESYEELPSELGTVQLYIVRLADLIATVDYPWSYADGDSQEMGDLMTDLIDEDDYDSFETPIAIAYDILPEYVANLLLIHHLKIHPDVRNRGLGGVIVETLLKQYDYCELIALKPFGIECKKMDHEDTPATRQAKAKALEASRKRLTLYYQRFGFRLISEQHMFFCSQLRKQPTLREAAGIRRRVKEAFQRDSEVVVIG